MTALLTLNNVFDVMSRLVPPGTVLSEADRAALESWSPYTRIMEGRQSDEIVIEEAPDRPDGMPYRTVYRSDGVVTESSAKENWKPMRRLRIAAIAAAVGGLLCFLAWKKIAYPMIALSIGCAALAMTTKPFGEDWLVDALKERYPGLPKEPRCAAILPTGLGGRLESNLSRTLNESPPYYVTAWRLEYFLNGYCADTEVHAYAIQKNVKLCRTLLAGLAAWQLVLVIRALRMGRRKLATAVPSPGAEKSLEQLSCPPSTLRGNAAAPWRQRFWIITSLASVLVLAWRVKVLDAKLTEMRIHTLRIVRDVGTRSRHVGMIGEKIGQQSPAQAAEVPENLRAELIRGWSEILRGWSEQDYRYYKEFLTLLIRRDLIDQEDAERTLFKYAGDTK